MLTLRTGMWYLVLLGFIRTLSIRSNINFNIEVLHDSSTFDKSIKTHHIRQQLNSMVSSDQTSRNCKIESSDIHTQKDSGYELSCNLLCLQAEPLSMRSSLT